MTPIAGLFLFLALIITAPVIDAIISTIPRKIPNRILDQEPVYDPAIDDFYFSADPNLYILLRDAPQASTLLFNHTYSIEVLIHNMTSIDQWSTTPWIVVTEGELELSQLSCSWWNENSSEMMLGPDLTTPPAYFPLLQDLLRFQSASSGNDIKWDFDLRAQVDNCIDITSTTSLISLDPYFSPDHTNRRCSAAITMTQISIHLPPKGYLSCTGTIRLLTPTRLHHYALSLVHYRPSGPPQVWAKQSFGFLYPSRYFKDPDKIPPYVPPTMTPLITYNNLKHINNTASVNDLVVNPYFTTIAYPASFPPELTPQRLLNPSELQHELSAFIKLSAAWQPHESSYVIDVILTNPNRIISPLKYPLPQFNFKVDTPFSLTVASVLTAQPRYICPLHMETTNGFFFSIKNIDALLFDSLTCSFLLNIPSGISPGLYKDFHLSLGTGWDYNHFVRAPQTNTLIDATQQITNLQYLATARAYGVSTAFNAIYPTDHAVTVANNAWKHSYTTSKYTLSGLTSIFDTTTNSRCLALRRYQLNNAPAYIPHTACQMLKLSVSLTIPSDPATFLTNHPLFSSLTALIPLSVGHYDETTNDISPKSIAQGEIKGNSAVNNDDCDFFYFTRLTDTPVNSDPRDETLVRVDFAGSLRIPASTFVIGVGYVTNLTCHVFCTTYMLLPSGKNYGRTLTGGAFALTLYNHQPTMSAITEVYGLNQWGANDITTPPASNPFLFTFPTPAQHDPSLITSFHKVKASRPLVHASFTAPSILSPRIVLHHQSLSAPLHNITREASKVVRSDRWYDPLYTPLGQSYLGERQWYKYYTQDIFIQNEDLLAFNFRAAEPLPIHPEVGRSFNVTSPDSIPYTPFTLYHGDVAVSLESYNSISTSTSTGFMSEDWDYPHRVQGNSFFANATQRDGVIISNFATQGIPITMPANYSAYESPVTHSSTFLRFTQDKMTFDPKYSNMSFPTTAPPITPVISSAPSNLKPNHILQTAGMITMAMHQRLNWTQIVTALDFSFIPSPVSTTALQRIALAQGMDPFTVHAIPPNYPITFANIAINDNFNNFILDFYSFDQFHLLDMPVLPEDSPVINISDALLQWLSTTRTKANPGMLFNTINRNVPNWYQSTPLFYASAWGHLSSLITGHNSYRNMGFDLTTYPQVDILRNYNMLDLPTMFFTHGGDMVPFTIMLNGVVQYKVDHFDVRVSNPQIQELMRDAQYFECIGVASCIDQTAKYASLPPIVFHPSDTQDLIFTFDPSIFDHHNFTTLSFILTAPKVSPFSIVTDAVAMAFSLSQQPSHIIQSSPLSPAPPYHVRSIASTVSFAHPNNALSRLISYDVSSYYLDGTPINQKYMYQPLHFTIQLHNLANTVDYASSISIFFQYPFFFSGRRVSELYDNDGSDTLYQRDVELFDHVMSSEFVDPYACVVTFPGGYTPVLVPHDIQFEQIQRRSRYHSKPSILFRPTPAFFDHINDVNFTCHLAMIFLTPANATDIWPNSGYSPGIISRVEIDAMVVPAVPLSILEPHTIQSIGVRPNLIVSNHLNDLSATNVTSLTTFNVTRPEIEVHSLHWSSPIMFAELLGSTAAVTSGFCESNATVFNAYLHYNHTTNTYHTVFNITFPTASRDDLMAYGVMSSQRLYYDHTVVQADGFQSFKAQVGRMLEFPADSGIHATDSQQAVFTVPAPYSDVVNTGGFHATTEACHMVLTPINNFTLPNGNFLSQKFPNSYLDSFLAPVWSSMTILYRNTPNPLFELIDPDTEMILRMSNQLAAQAPLRPPFQPSVVSYPLHLEDTANLQLKGLPHRRFIFDFGEDAVRLFNPSSSPLVFTTPYSFGECSASKADCPLLHSIRRVSTPYFLKDLNGDDINKYSWELSLNSIDSLLHNGSSKELCASHVEASRSCIIVCHTTDIMNESVELSSTPFSPGDVDPSILNNTFVGQLLRFYNLGLFTTGYVSFQRPDFAAPRTVIHALRQHINPTLDQALKQPAAWEVTDLFTKTLYISLYTTPIDPMTTAPLDQAIPTNYRFEAGTTFNTTRDLMLFQTSANLITTPIQFAQKLEAIQRFPTFQPFKWSKIDIATIITEQLAGEPPNGHLIDLQTKNINMINIQTRHLYSNNVSKLSYMVYSRPMLTAFYFARPCMFPSMSKIRVQLNMIVKDAYFYQSEDYNQYVYNETVHRNIPETILPREPPVVGSRYTYHPCWWGVMSIENEVDPVTGLNYIFLVAQFDYSTYTAFAPDLDIQTDDMTSDFPGLNSVCRRYSVVYSCAAHIVLHPFDITHTTLSSLIAEDVEIHYEPVSVRLTSGFLIAKSPRPLPIASTGNPVVNTTTITSSPTIYPCRDHPDVLHYISNPSAYPQFSLYNGLNFEYISTIQRPTVAGFTEIPPFSFESDTGPSPPHFSIDPNDLTDAQFTMPSDGLPDNIVYAARSLTTEPEIYNIHTTSVNVVSSYVYHNLTVTFIHDDPTNPINTLVFGNNSAYLRNVEVYDVDLYCVGRTDDPTSRHLLYESQSIYGSLPPAEQRMSQIEYNAATISVKYHNQNQIDPALSFAQTNKMFTNLDIKPNKLSSITITPRFLYTYLNCTFNLYSVENPDHGNFTVNFGRRDTAIIQYAPIQRYNATTTTSSLGTTTFIDFVPRTFSRGTNIIISYSGVVSHAVLSPSLSTTFQVSIRHPIISSLIDKSQTLATQSNQAGTDVLHQISVLQSNSFNYQYNITNFTTFVILNCRTDLLHGASGFITFITDPTSDPKTLQYYITYLPTGKYALSNPAHVNMFYQQQLVLSSQARLSLSHNFVSHGMTVQVGGTTSSLISPLQLPQIGKVQEKEDPVEPPNVKKNAQYNPIQFGNQLLQTSDPVNFSVISSPHTGPPPHGTKESLQYNTMPQVGATGSSSLSINSTIQEYDDEFVHYTVNLETKVTLSNIRLIADLSQLRLHGDFYNTCSISSIKQSPMMWYNDLYSTLTQSTVNVQNGTFIRTREQQERFVFSLFTPTNITNLSDVQDLSSGPYDIGNKVDHTGASIGSPTTSQQGQFNFQYNPTGRSNQLFISIPPLIVPPISSTADISDNFASLSVQCKLRRSLYIGTPSVPIYTAAYNSLGKVIGTSMTLLTSTLLTSSQQWAEALPSDDPLTPVIPFTNIPITEQLEDYVTFTVTVNTTVLYTPFQASYIESVLFRKLFRPSILNRYNSLTQFTMNPPDNLGSDEPVEAYRHPVGFAEVYKGIYSYDYEPFNTLTLPDDPNFLNVSIFDNLSLPSTIPYDDLLIKDYSKLNTAAKEQKFPTMPYFAQCYEDLMMINSQGRYDTPQSLQDFPVGTHQECYPEHFHEKPSNLGHKPFMDKEVYYNKLCPGKIYYIVDNTSLSQDIQYLRPDSTPILNSRPLYKSDYSTVRQSDWSRFSSREDAIFKYPKYYVYIPWQFWDIKDKLLQTGYPYLWSSDAFSRKEYLHPFSPNFRKLHTEETTNLAASAYTLNEMGKFPNFAEKVIFSDGGFDVLPRQNTTFAPTTAPSIPTISEYSQFFVHDWNFFFPLISKPGEMCYDEPQNCPEVIDDPDAEFADGATTTFLFPKDCNYFVETIYPSPKMTKRPANSKSKTKLDQIRSHLDPGMDNSTPPPSPPPKLFFLYQQDFIRVPSRNVSIVVDDYGKTSLQENIVFNEMVQLTFAINRTYIDAHPSGENDTNTSKRAKSPKMSIFEQQLAYVPYIFRTQFYTMTRNNVLQTNNASISDKFNYINIQNRTYYHGFKRLTTTDIESFVPNTTISSTYPIIIQDVNAGPDAPTYGTETSVLPKDMFAYEFSITEQQYDYLHPTEQYIFFAEQTPAPYSFDYSKSNFRRAVSPHYCSTSQPQFHYDPILGHSDLWFDQPCGYPCLARCENYHPCTYNFDCRSSFCQLTSIQGVGRCMPSI